MSASVLLWYAAWTCADLFLLMALVGLAVANGGDRFAQLWLCFGTLAAIFALNAYGFGLIGF